MSLSYAPCMNGGGGGGGGTWYLFHISKLTLPDITTELVLVLVLVAKYVLQVARKFSCKWKALKYAIHSLYEYTGEKLVVIKHML